MHKTLAASLFCCSAALASGADDYLCIVDKVTGFSHDPATGTWDQVTFLPGERFLIKSTNGNGYIIERVDEILAWSAGCRLREDLDTDSFTCEAGTNTVHFNRKEQRITAIRYFGYWNGSKDSMSISIGSCTTT